MKTILITGAGGGLGQSLVQAFASSSWHVIAASRGLPGEQNVGLDEQSEMLSTAALDVTDTRQIELLVQAILDRFGHLDVLVNNAGRAEPAPLESASIANARKTMDINFWGAIELIRAVLPSMRARRSGHIVNISSLSAHIGLPLDGVYSASKAALERACESMFAELLPFSVHVSNAIPGAIHTPFTGKMRAATSIDRSSAYLGLCERVLRGMEGDGSGADPLGIAEEIVALVTERHPPLTVAVGDQARAVLKALSGLCNSERRELQGQFSEANWWARQALD